MASVTTTRVPKGVMFLLLALGCLVAPALIASLVSFAWAPVGGVEALIIFLACVGAAVLIWRRTYTRA